MSRSDFFKVSQHDQLSKKMVSKLESLRSQGYFSENEVTARNLHLAVGKSGSKEKGLVAFYLLVDKEDGVIMDAKFQAFGDAAFLAISDIAATYVIGKTYEQMRRTSKELLIHQLSDDKDKYKVPTEFENYLLVILDAFKQGASQCIEIPLELHTPLSHEEKKEGESYPGWITLTKENKIKVIEEVLDKEIRPYVALDEGGVEVIDLKENELHIAYKGNCTSCFSSVGSTLSAIQEILQEKIDKELTVVPNLDNLKI